MHAKVTGDDFTFVATGDIAEMWIRDSAMQVRMTRVINNELLRQAV
jgi:meiotically up-regulated gene 157 (Mug157) protein